MPLVDSDNWKSTFVSLRQLRFHPNNPRFPEIRGKTSEREIIHELSQRGKVAQLARDISETGYLRQERLIVVKEGAKCIVYEGNRRLCALKLLDNPSLAPANMQKTFKRFADKAKLPKKIAVEIVPNRFEAEVVMYAKHAGSLFSVGWEPLQQAAFVAAKIEEGASIDEVVKITPGLSREDVVNCLAAIDLYRMCRLAEVNESAQKLIDSPDEFPYSTIFERLIKPKRSREALGFQITDQGLLAPPPEEILPVLSQILEDAASTPKKIDTRLLNTEKQQREYVAGLKFSPSRPMSTTIQEMETKYNKGKVPESQDAKSTQPKPTIHTPKPHKPSTKLLSRDVICEIASPKLLEIIEEGKKLDIAKMPATGGIMLRCILETALQAAIDARGYRKELNAKFKKDSNEVGVVQLLNEAKNGSLFDIGLDSSDKRSIPLLTGKQGPLSYEVLHLFVHNPHWRATKDSVMQLRDVIVPILKKAIVLPSA